MGTVLRATVLYWLLLFTLRLVGRRAASQLTPFELIVIFLFGGLTVQAIVADDRSVINAVTGVFAIALNHLLVSALKQRWVGFRKVVDGTPIVVVQDGRVDKALLHGLRMVEEDLMAAAREKDIEDFEDIQLAVVERDGSILVRKR